jgi:hypothetical protein
MAIIAAARLQAQPRITRGGIDTLTGAVGRNGSFHGSGCDAALLPNSKRLGTKILEDTAWQKMALAVEGVLDGGVDREETLG